jgi:hypothetical protein
MSACEARITSANRSRSTRRSCPAHRWMLYVIMRTDCARAGCPAIEPSVTLTPRSFAAQERRSEAQYIITHSLAQTCSANITHSRAWTSWGITACLPTTIRRASLPQRMFLGSRRGFPQDTAAPRWPALDTGIRKHPSPERFLGCRGLINIRWALQPALRIPLLAAHPDNSPRYGTRRPRTFGLSTFPQGL